MSINQIFNLKSTSIYEHSFNKGKNQTIGIQGVSPANPIVFCACTCDNSTAFDFLYNLLINENVKKDEHEVSITKRKIKTKNIFNLTEKYHLNTHYNNFITLISKNKIYFKTYIINKYGVDKYILISPLIKITSKMLTKYDHCVEKFDFPITNFTKDETSFYCNNYVYFGKIRNSVLDYLNTRDSNVTIFSQNKNKNKKVENSFKRVNKDNKTNDKSSNLYNKNIIFEYDKKPFGFILEKKINTKKSMDCFLKYLENQIKPSTREMYHYLINYIKNYYKSAFKMSNYNNDCNNKLETDVFLNEDKKVVILTKENNNVEDKENEKNLEEKKEKNKEEKKGK